MGKRLLFIIVILSLFTAFAHAANKKFTLVIDAGHGGHDSGAIGALSKEKDINLNVALAFGRYVEKNCPDVNVVYTRKTDVFIPLHTRADIANRAKADLFISIHTNAVAVGHDARGFQTYTLGMHRAKDNLDVAMRENAVISMEKDYKTTYEGFNPNSSESYIMFEFIQSANMQKSVELAKYVQKNVCNIAGRLNKGVHQAGFLVLRETSMPSCLIELGFITTPDEENFLNTDSGIESLARGIYNAFVEYKNQYSSKITVPFASSDNKKAIDVRRIVPQSVGEPSNHQYKPVVKEQPKQSANRQQSENDNTVSPRVDEDMPPVFKVQILASARSLRAGSPDFKGHDDIDSFNEASLIKYTIGSTTNYNEISRLRKQLQSDFPQCFIIAFRNNQKMDVNKAIQEFMRNNKK